MCSYTLTHCLCILIVYVYVLHLLVMLCCIVIISIICCAYNQRYRYLPVSTWGTDLAGRVELYYYCLNLSEYIMDCDGYSFGGPSCLICWLYTCWWFVISLLLKACMYRYECIGNKTKCHCEILGKCEGKLGIWKYIFGKWEKGNGLREIGFLRSCYCCESLGTRVNEMKWKMNRL